MTTWKETRASGRVPLSRGRGRADSSSLRLELSWLWDRCSLPAVLAAWAVVTATSGNRGPGSPQPGARDAPRARGKGGQASIVPTLQQNVQLLWEALSALRGLLPLACFSAQLKALFLHGVSQRIWRLVPGPHVLAFRKIYGTPSLPLQLSLLVPGAG